MHQVIITLECASRRDAEKLCFRMYQELADHPDYGFKFEDFTVEIESIAEPPKRDHDPTDFPIGTSTDPTMAIMAGLFGKEK